ncbi:2-oxoglutarate dehydrogenase complex dihydrolipoyllysine-residue succinyltransferase [bacterium]|nr:2-oxoglutarate dehydrogenase complex dihydrolipoyllysine-residue succinyltransferase [bacterium]
MPQPIVVPDLGESITEATIIRWLKNQGERVQAGEVLLELETEKVNLEVGADKSGVLARIDRAAGQDVKVGETIGMIEESEAKPAEEAKPEAPKEEAKPEPKPEPKPEAKEEKPAPSSEQTFKKEPRDTIREYVVPQAVPAPQPKPAEAQRPETPTPSAAEGRREERVRMSRRRKTIAERLVQAQHMAAMLTTFNEIDMSAVARIRARHKQAFEEKYGVKLGLTSFFVKAAVAALLEFPAVNAEMDRDDIVYKYYYDIGVAVDTPEGLVVPVIRDADRKSFAEIEKAVRDLAEKARMGKLAIDDLRGGTFTITNGGVYGSLLSTPILNLPQVAILGLHRIQDRPVVINNEIQIRPMMYVALSYDHRMIDGRTAVQFLIRIKELVETPERLLVEM